MFIFWDYLRFSIGKWGFMSAVMQRLQREINIIPARYNAENQTYIWQFSAILEKQKKAFFEKALIRHGILTIEYGVLCTQLMHDYQKNRNDEIIEKHLVAALMMAEYLTYIYRHHLVVPSEVERLQREQQIYRSLLQKKGYQFLTADWVDVKADSFSQTVRKYTVATNAPRLFLVRVRRLLDMCVPLVAHADKYCRFVNGLNTVAKPFFGYLAWIFFIPRLFVNLFLLFKHVIPGTWMDDKEKEMDWLYRLHAQLQRRWFELANDSVWMVAGILACFVWTGPLVWVGIYVNAALYIYDVGTAAIRAGLEITRMKNLALEYEALYKKATGEERKQIVNFQAHLQRRISFEQKKLLLSVINTTALAIAIGTTLPFVLVNPLIPLIGAAALVLITIVAYAALKWLESQKPEDRIGTFFSESPTAPKPLINEFELDVTPLNAKL